MLIGDTAKTIPHRIPEYRGLFLAHNLRNSIACNARFIIDVNAIRSTLTSHYIIDMGTIIHTAVTL